MVFCKVSYSNIMDRKEKCRLHYSAVVWMLKWSSEKGDPECMCTETPIWKPGTGSCDVDKWLESRRRRGKGIEEGNRAGGHV